MVTRNQAIAFFFGVLFLVMGLCAITIQVYYNSSLIRTEGVITDMTPASRSRSYGEYYILKYEDVHGNAYEDDVYSPSSKIGDTFSLYYFNDSPQRLESPLNNSLYFVAFLLFAGLFLTLGRSAIIHWREISLWNKRKCWFSIVSCVSCIALSFIIIHININEYKDYFGLGITSLGQVAGILLALLLIILMNILIWLFVFFKSFSKKRVHH